MGLLGFGYPWEEGEEAWMFIRQKAAQDDPERQHLLRPIYEEPNHARPQDAADDDSCFMKIGPMMIHYKLAHSQVSS